MGKNEDLEQANQGAPAADIPDLKKKEKERKKAGAAWSGAKPGGSPFGGATGGMGAGARAAASAAVGGAEAGVAAGSGGFFGSISSFLAGLMATSLGQALVMAGVAAFLVGAGVLGYALFKGGGADAAGGDLGALASNIKYRAGGSDRTGYITGKEDIAFEQAKKPEPPKTEPAKPEEKKEEPAPKDQIADGAAAQRPDWRGGGLQHNLSGSKLSSSLGGNFGSHNVMGGNGNAPKFDAGKAQVKIAGGQKGQMSAMKSGKTGSTRQGATGQKMKANRALGQLRAAKFNSIGAAGASSADAASAGAQTAFDGANGRGDQTIGGPGNNGNGSNGNGTVNPTGDGGAPDVTVPDPRGHFTDGSQAAIIAAIASMAEQAGQLKKTAEMLMIAGIALIAVGVALLFWPMTAVGIALIAIGSMLVGMSIVMGQMADMMQNMAQSMSEALAARNGDQNQNNINKYCIRQAYERGTKPANCTPPDDVSHGSTYDDVHDGSVRDHRTRVDRDGRTRMD